MKKFAVSLTISKKIKPLQACIKSLKSQLIKNTEGNEKVVSFHIKPQLPYNLLEIEIDEKCNAEEEVLDVTSFIKKLDQWFSYIFGERVKHGVIEYEVFEINNNQLSFQLAPPPDISKIEIKDETTTEQPNLDSSESLLLLIDGSNVLNRAFYATYSGKEDQDIMQTSDGKYTHAVFGFAKILFKLIREHSPTNLAIGWDKSPKTWRKQIYPDYKATRKEKDDKLLEQFKTTMDLFNDIISQYAIAEFEADDIIGSWAHKWEQETDGDVLIISNDQDIFQCLSPRVSIIKGKDERFTEEDFKEKYTIDPQQWIDVKAILGDASDNIKGIPGIGEKAALPLIQSYRSIEGVYQNFEDDALDPKFKRYLKKLEAGKEDAFFFKKLVTIETEIPDIVQLDIGETCLDVDKDKLLSRMEELEFDLSQFGDLREVSEKV